MEWTPAKEQQTGPLLALLIYYEPHVSLQNPVFDFCGSLSYSVAFLLREVLLSPRLLSLNGKNDDRLVCCFNKRAAFLVRGFSRSLSWSSANDSEDGGGVGARDDEEEAWRTADEARWLGLLPG